MTLSLEIGFVGLSHLGIVSSVAAAARGANVLAFDPNPETVERLAAGDTIVTEPGLVDALRKFRDRIRFTDRLDDLGGCGIVYISCDTPVADDSGQGQTDEIRHLATTVDHALPETIPLVILSQLQPGFMRSLPRSSRPLYHQVETLVFGRALERAVEPERIIIGAGDPSMPLPACYLEFLELFDCPLIPMRYESAEVAKISINCMLAASVSATNVLAEVCDHVGADWAEVQGALRTDRRIGPHAYLSPGLGISGGNLERDLAALSGMAEGEAVNAGFIDAMVCDSRYRLDWVLRVFQSRVLPQAPQPTVGVLGLAYKQDTHSIKNSPALHLVGRITPGNARVYDPVARLPEGSGSGVVQVDAPSGVFQDADAAFVMTPWDAFRELPVQDLLGSMSRKIIVDPYRVFDAHLCREAGAEYFTLGDGSNR